METLSYKLEVFEGPLDLLLTLIAKNKLNIYDIPITLLLEQYMEQIERMQSENLDIASEFLEMAARLVHIKSVSLLPKREEEEALRRELTGQLLEYQQCRETAEKLRAMVSFDRLVRPQSKIPADHAYKRHHAPEEMLGGMIYDNDSGHLPSAPGRMWYKADINYYEGRRNKHRILYSNDGLIFVTYDYYETFYEIV